MELKNFFHSIYPKKYKKPEFYIEEHPAKYILYFDISGFYYKNINIKINERVMRINNGKELIKEFDVPGEVVIKKVKGEILNNNLSIILPYNSFTPNTMINVPIEIKE